MTTEAELEALTPEELRTMYREARQFIQEIASSATDTHLDEAVLFLRYRKQAQVVCENQNLDYTDYTAQGQNRL